MLTSATRGQLNLFFLALANEAVVVSGSYPGLNWCLWRSNKVICILLDFIINISAGCISFCCQTLSANMVNTINTLLVLQYQLLFLYPLFQCVDYCSICLKCEGSWQCMGFCLQIIGQKCPHWDVNPGPDRCALYVFGE